VGSPNGIAAFRRTILTHFSKHGRELPWRHTRDPYCIYVSEVMLQQTQVPRVVEKYQEFVRLFPSWEALAGASLVEVLKAWLGLGYNRRAKFLHEAARIVVREHAGKLPRDPEVLRQLPGIGAATAASIAAFAFDVPTVFIETNIRSVFIHHFFAGRADVGDCEVLPLVEQALDRRSPGRWYSALMDYGVELKKKVGNPSRRSRHHVRQSRFEGSDRQVRGAILREVLAEPGLTCAQMGKRLEGQARRVKDVIQGMLDERLLQVIRGRYSVPQ
jgi:A/G-specific adenine glycosylase